MSVIFNKITMLLTTVIACGAYGSAIAQSDTKKIAVDFKAVVGDREFACGESYESIGTSESTVTPTDFRFYVSDVALIDESGNAVPLELEQDSKWQYQNVALLDFEDGTSACDNGTAEMNTTVVGTVPEGDYQGLQFTMGVPEDLNHEDAAIAPSPLNLTSMWWNWQGGYKFLRVDLETDKAIANSQMSHSKTTQASEQPSIFESDKEIHSHRLLRRKTTEPAVTVGQNTHNNYGDSGHGAEEQTSSNAYLIHLGSTGCGDSAQSNMFDCANPNRVSVTLENFNPEDNVVIADLAELLAQSDLATNEANTAAGCMSSPEDSDCMPIMQNLSLSSSNIADSEQYFFFVE